MLAKVQLREATLIFNPSPLHMKEFAQNTFSKRIKPSLAVGTIKTNQKRVQAALSPKNPGVQASPTSTDSLARRPPFQYGSSSPRGSKNAGFLRPFISVKEHSRHPTLSPSPPSPISPSFTSSPGSSSSPSPRAFPLRASRTSRRQGAAGSKTSSSCRPNYPRFSSARSRPIQSRPNSPPRVVCRESQTTPSPDRNHRGVDKLSRSVPLPHKTWDRPKTRRGKDFLDSKQATRQTLESIFFQRPQTSRRRILDFTGDAFERPKTSRGRILTYEGDP